MKNMFSKLLMCPQTKSQLYAVTKTIMSIKQYDSFENIIFLVNSDSSRWYPVINNIPRILPDRIRDREWDEKFYNKYFDIFSKMKIIKSFFNNSSYDKSFIESFNRQRFIWGNQPDWDSIYIRPMGYHSSNIMDEGKEVIQKDNFFAMNLQCYFGDQPTFENFLNKINSVNNKIILDVGCGTGEKRKFIDKTKNKYIEIDILGEKQPDLQSSANALPFFDSSFDYVICDSLLEHVHDPTAVTKEIFRVLKTGGEGYFVVPFSYKNHGSPFDFYRYTKSGLHTLLKNYSKISIYSFGGFVHAYGHMVESFYPHLPLGMGRIIKAIHNFLFFFLNKLDRYDKYKLFSRGFYAFVTK